MCLCLCIDLHTHFGVRLWTVLCKALEFWNLGMVTHGAAAPLRKPCGMLGYGAVFRDLCFQPRLHSKWETIRCICDCASLQLYDFSSNDRHILTSNIDQRTKCCLLSGKLFKVRVESLFVELKKVLCFVLGSWGNFDYVNSQSLIRSNAPQCLLMASKPHPMTDLSYSTYSVETELIPGIDLFSEPDRGNLGTTVASLSFLCHWLYTSGHLLKVPEQHSLTLILRWFVHLCAQLSDPS